MNKTVTKILIGILLLSIGLIVFFVMKPDKEQLTYSNLNDEQSLDQVTKDLMDAGLPKTQADIFKVQVEGTNAFLKDYHSFKPGFTTIERTGVEYDEQDAFGKYGALIVPYPDINCRIGAWTLMKDLISVKPWDPNKLEEFYYETQIIDEHPNAKMNPEEKLNFFGVYAPIVYKPNGNIKDTLDAIQKEWKERNVQIKDSNRTLISAFQYDPEEKGLAVRHAGVLVKRANDLLFVEKWNPTMPFQASIFKSREELKKYLFDRFEEKKYTANFIVLENDKLLE